MITRVSALGWFVLSPFDSCSVLARLGKEDVEELKTEEEYDIPSELHNGRRYINHTFHGINDFVRSPVKQSYERTAVKSVRPHLMRPNEKSFRSLSSSVTPTKGISHRESSIISARAAAYAASGISRKSLKVLGKGALLNSKRKTWAHGRPNLKRKKVSYIVMFVSAVIALTVMLSFVIKETPRRSAALDMGSTFAPDDDAFDALLIEEDT